MWRAAVISGPSLRRPIVLLAIREWPPAFEHVFAAFLTLFCRLLLLLLLPKCSFPAPETGTCRASDERPLVPRRNGPSGLATSARLLFCPLFAHQIAHLSLVRDSLRECCTFGPCQVGRKEKAGQSVGVAATFRLAVASCGPQAAGRTLQCALCALHANGNAPDWRRRNRRPDWDWDWDEQPVTLF